MFVIVNSQSLNNINSHHLMKMLIQSNCLRKLCAVRTQTMSTAAMAAANSLAHSFFSTKPSLFLCSRNRVSAFTFSTASAVSSNSHRTKKWRQSAVASAVELGGVKIDKQGYQFITTFSQNYMFLSAIYVFFSLGVCAELCCR